MGGFRRVGQVFAAHHARIGGPRRLGPPYEKVSLIGGSVRAAAFSALRAGLQPWCLDLFADSDLRAVADTRRCPIDKYPQGLLELMRDAPPGPVIYTGGLENYPRLIEQIARQRALWGNDAEALRRSRDPFFVANLLDENGIKCPALFRGARRASKGNGLASLACASGSERLGLRKPLKGAGGSLISFANIDDPESGAFYFQEFIPGPSFSAVFCALPEYTEFLGVTEQLVGESWLNAKPFHYCGSIGPVTLSSPVQNTLMRLGEILRTGCGLCGLFGIDFILRDNHPWLLEVNPRYTASIEVLELATGLRAMEHHRAAFLVSRDAQSSGRSAHRKIGKAIMFTESRIVFPESGPWTGPGFADIPNPGDVIEQGWPILTLFAESPTIEECREELMKSAFALESSLCSNQR